MPLLSRPLAKRSLLMAVLAAGYGCSESSGPKVIPIATISIVGAPGTLQVGSTVLVSAQAKDDAGAVLTGRAFAWSSSDLAVATVAQDGTITAVAPGPVTITVASEGRTGTVVITIIPVPVASIAVSLAAGQIPVGGTTQATAALSDAQGRPLTGREITWSSSAPSVATVDQTGKVTGVAAGGASIVATSGGVSGSAQVFVAAAVSCSGTLQIGIGEVRTLTGAERSGLCLGGSSSAEYVLIPFNSSQQGSTFTPLQFSATNTSAPLSPSISLDRTADSRLARPDIVDSRTREIQFRIRESRDLAAPLAALKREGSRRGQIARSSMITGIPANPAVGSVYPINTNLSGNTCTGAKVLHDARVVAVTARVMVLVDLQSPSGGYTDAEMADFGQVFESAGYDVDTLNFGAPTDIDNNGRIAILFTPAVNALASTPGTIVGGLQASRDLFPLNASTGCIGSNEGEMFYMPVPDVASTINGNYTNKTSLANRVQTVLAHEFQHLINAGRRIYITDATEFEEIWLNEGLSHIAEELVYYGVSGQTPGTNIDLPRVQASQAQLDAINNYQVQNLARLRIYMLGPEDNSPYVNNDDLATRGATWQLLRFAADRKGGSQRSTWRGLVDSPLSGLENFASIFGSVTPIVRDWAVAQYADDLGIPVSQSYVHPSWNFRSLVSAINSGVFPLVTRTLSAAPLDVSIRGGSASYIRFRVNGGGPTATISASAAGQPVPANVELMLLRTH